MRSSNRLTPALVALAILALGLGLFLWIVPAERPGAVSEGATAIVEPEADRAGSGERGPPEVLHPTAPPAREPSAAPARVEALELGDLSEPSGSSLIVRVLDEREEPLARASVNLWRHSEASDIPYESFGLGSTDVAGRARFSGLEAGSYRLQVQARGFAPYELPALALAGSGTLELVVPLSPNAYVEGRVLTESGVPVAQAEVHLVPRLHAREHDPANRLAAATDGLGRFRLGPVGSGLYVLWAESPTHGRGEVSDLRVPVPEESGEALQQDVQIAPGEVLAGRVSTPADAPIDGALVRLQRLGGGALPRTALTDAEGLFRFEHVPPGEYRLVASAGDLLPARLSGIHPGRTDLTFELAERAGVRGRVLDAHSGAPIGSFEVETWTADPRSARLGRRLGKTRHYRDGEGRFSLGDLRSGTFVVRVAAEGYARADSRPFTLEAGTSSTSFELDDLRLERGATLEGIVYDVLGHPVAGYSLSIRRVGGLEDREVASSHGSRYSIEGLGPGSYLLTGSAPDPDDPSGLGQRRLVPVELFLVEGARHEQDLHQER